MGAPSYLLLITSHLSSLRDHTVVGIVVTAATRVATWGFTAAWGLSAALRASALIVAVTARGLAAAALSALSVLLSILEQGCLVDERRLLEELTAGDVSLLLRIREETDVQRLDVLLHVELLRALSATLGALCREVEDAQSVDLHLARVEELLDETGAELLQHAKDDVGGVDTSVLGDVVRHLTGVQGLDSLHSREVLTIGRMILHLVLIDFINNFCHSL